MKKTLKLILLITLIATYVTGCKKEEIGEEDTKAEVSLPVVVTKDALQVSSQSAVCNAEVTSDGGFPLLAKGICWSIGSEPNVEGSHTNNGTDLGSYSCSITSLNSNTTYYYRAYASNEKGTSYGETKTFKTST
ncbi:hypothetical protein ACFLRZ_00850 [Bacteroidota bacterium]